MQIETVQKDGDPHLRASYDNGDVVTWGFDFLIQDEAGVIELVEYTRLLDSSQIPDMSPSELREGYESVEEAFPPSDFNLVCRGLLNRPHTREIHYDGSVIAEALFHGVDNE